MYPPPMTSSFPGMSARASAPVESITRGSPMLNTGGIAGRDPTATMHLSNVSWLCVPSGAVSCSVPELRNVPRACTSFTPRASHN